VYTDRSCHLTAFGPYGLLSVDQPNAARMRASRAPSFACELRWTLRMVVDMEAVILPWLLYLSRHAIFLNECPVNGRPGELCRRDWYSMAKTYNQCRKSQCPVGLLWVHWMSRRHNTYELMDGIWDKLCHMNTDLGHDVVDQLTFG